MECKVPSGNICKALPLEPCGVPSVCAVWAFSLNCKRVLTSGPFGVSAVIGTYMQSLRAQQKQQNDQKTPENDIFFSASRPEASATVTIQPPPSNLTRGGRQGKPSVRISEDFQIWGWSSAPTSSPSSGRTLPVGASPSSGKTLPVGAEKNPEVSQNGSKKNLVNPEKKPEKNIREKRNESEKIRNKSQDSEKNPVPRMY